MRSDRVNNVNAHLTVNNDAFSAEDEQDISRPMRLIAMSNFLSISFKADILLAPFKCACRLQELSRQAAIALFQTSEVAPDFLGADALSTCEKWSPSPPSAGPFNSARVQRAGIAAPLQTLADPVQEQSWRW